MNDRVYQVTGNELFMSFPYEPHCTGQYDLSPCSFYAVQINLKNKDKILGLNREYSQALAAILLNREFRHLRFQPEEQNWLKLAFENISREKPEALRLGVQYLSCFLFKVPAFMPVKRGTKKIDDPVMLRVIEYIETEYRENINLSDLAELAGYSLSRFKTKFKATTGITPANYIRFKKLEYAKHLLVTTDKTVTDIAMDAGFSSSNYFCTVMKNLTSYSPSEYRESQNVDRVGGVEGQAGELVDYGGKE